MGSMDLTDRIRRALLLCLLTVVAVYSTNSVPDPSTHCPQALASRSYQTYIFANKCYEFVTRERRWFQAWQDCSGGGGRMVSIKNYATQQFLINTMNRMGWSRNGVWTGLHDWYDETRWLWATEDRNVHENLGWAFWAPGHPEQGLGSLMAAVRDCVQMRREDGYRWHETYCDSQFYTYFYICQYAVVPPSTTTTISTTTTTTPATTNTTSSTTVRTTTVNPKRPPSGERGKGTTIMTTSTQEEPAVMYAQTMDAALSGGSLAGVIVACLLILLLIIIILVAMLIRRRRKKASADNSSSDQFDNPVYGNNPGGLPISSDSNSTTPATSPAHEGRVLLSANRAQFAKPRHDYTVNLNDQDFDPDLIKKGAVGLSVRLDDDDDDDDLKKPRYLYREPSEERAMNVYNDPPKRPLEDFGAVAAPFVYDEPTKMVPEDDELGTVNLYDNQLRRAVDNVYQNPQHLGAISSPEYSVPPRASRRVGEDQAALPPPPPLAPRPRLNSADVKFEGKEYHDDRPPLSPKPRLDDIEVDRDLKKVANLAVYDSPKAMNPYDEIPAEQYLPEPNMYESLENLQNVLEEKRKMAEAEEDDIDC